MQDRLSKLFLQNLIVMDDSQLQWVIIKKNTVIGKKNTPRKS
ncbi:hypothetical protein JOC75_002026 [Metabacillus crassostreae]|nr:hypothetical protein [Metabacillus crassostreae]MBM7604053.1 hypothetical protein [Metabacillus crassostreae]